MKYNNRTQRDRGIDIVKLCASIVVVSIHTYLFKDVSDAVYSFWRIAVSSAAVPFFFILSGYFLGEKVRNQGGEKTSNSIKNNKIHLTKCYCVWASWYSILYFTWDVLNKKNIVVALAKHAISFFVGSPDTIMWYVATAVAGLYLFEKILKCESKKVMFLIATFISIALYVLSFYWHDLPKEMSLLVSVKSIYDYFMPSERIFIFRLNWFFIGIFCSWILNIDLSKEKLFTGRDGIGLICCAWSLLLVFKYGFKEDSVYVCILTMLWYVVLALFLIKMGYMLTRYFSFRDSKINYGNIATGVYFLHATVIWIYDVVVLKTNAGVNRAIEFIVCLIVTSFVATCISKNKKAFSIFF